MNSERALERCRYGDGSACITGNILVSTNFRLIVLKFCHSTSLLHFILLIEHFDFFPSAELGGRVGRFSCQVGPMYTTDAFCQCCTA